MKRLIRGLLYDTATSKRIAQWSWYDEEEKRGATGVLYKTRGGAFFEHAHAEFRVKKRGKWVEMESDDFYPIAPDELSKWLNENDIEVLDEEALGTLPEATAGPSKAN